MLDWFPQLVRNFVTPQDLVNPQCGTDRSIPNLVRWRTGKLARRLAGS